MQLVSIRTRSITQCQIDISSGTRGRSCVLKQSPVFPSPVLGLLIKVIQGLEQIQMSICEKFGDGTSGETDEEVITVPQ